LRAARNAFRGARFTCFTGAKVQIMTLSVLRDCGRRAALFEVCALLALLVQKYKK
jgi:hypothetical protein